VVLEESIAYTDTKASSETAGCSFVLGVDLDGVCAFAGARINGPVAWQDGNRTLQRIVELPG
jgi:hypothetical protein